MAIMGVDTGRAPSEPSVARVRSDLCWLALLEPLEWLGPKILGMKDRSSVESSEALSSNRRLMTSRQFLHTRRELCTPNFSPDTTVVHLESKMQPQVRQWCFLRNAVKGVWQRKHSLTVSSFIQNSLLRTCLRILASCALI